MYVIVLLGAVIFSEKLHEFLGSILLAVCLDCFIIILFIKFLLECVCGVIDTCKCKQERRERDLWNEIKGMARLNVTHFIQEEGELPVAVLCRLFMIYHHEKLSNEELAGALMKAYREDENKRDLISYILLKDCSNEVIENMFSEMPTLKQECEEISKRSVEFLMKFDMKKGGIDRAFVAGLLNSCLFNSSLNKEQTTHLLRGMLSWILRKQSGPVSEEEKSVMIAIVTLIPSIKDKLSGIGISDRYISENIDKVTNSKWFRDTLTESYKIVKKNLNNGNSDLAQINNDIKSMCMLCVYYERLGLLQRGSLHGIINRRKRELNKYLDSECKVISLALYASLMEGAGGGEDFLYEVAAVISLCAEQVVGLLGTGG